MSERTHQDSVSSVSATRNGGLTVFFLLGLVVLIVVVATFLGLFIDFGNRDVEDEPLLATVTRGLFQHVILAQGEIESSNSVDVRCEVRARAGYGPSGPSTTILDVIPEGSLVQKGDWLVTLDSSILEQEKLAEQIILNTVEANMIEAKAVYDTALIDQEEFLTRGLGRINVNLAANSRAVGSSLRSPANEASESRFVASDSSASSGSISLQRNPPQPSSPPPTQSSSDARADRAEKGPAPLINPSYGELKRFIENEISVADNSLRKAQLSFDSMKRKASRGQVDRLQLESEQFRLYAVQNVGDLAKQKLAALENYTKKRVLVQLKANFEVASVGHRTAMGSYEEQRAKVKQIDDQIAKCRVVAPAAGQVVFKNVQSGRAGSEFVVEPGSPVRENQVIIMLPDPTEMQVKALVDESRVNLVWEGMPATVRVDAFESFHSGRVTKVNKYAEAASWFSDGMGKQYIALIRLLDIPRSIRVGFTAEVRMFVEERPDALQMPFQTVYERGGKTFCLVKREDSWETTEIVISSTNEKMVVLDERASESVREGDHVAMNPIQYLDLFDHSRFPQEGPPEDREKKLPRPTKAT